MSDAKGSPEHPAGAGEWRSVVDPGRPRGDRVIVPSVLWAATLLVPFLPLATGQKAWASGGLAVAAEGVFPTPPFLISRKMARRYRRRLGPRAWLRKLREVSPRR